MGTHPNMRRRVWCCVEHLALWVYHGHSSLVLWSFLGNFQWVHFGHTASKACHLLDITSLKGAVTSYVMSQRHMCIGHVTFYYKRSADASMGGSFLLFVLSSGSTLSPETHMWPVPNACRS